MQIYDGRTSFYQWDLNQLLTAEGLEVGDEVHFANIMSAEALVVKAYALEDGTVVADVPNALLQASYPITAYRYIKGDTEEYTREDRTFTVQKRPKPVGYVYTPDERYTLDAAVQKALDEAKEAGGFNGKSAYEVAVENGFEGTEEEWLASLITPYPTEVEDKVRELDGTSQEHTGQIEKLEEDAARQNAANREAFDAIDSSMTALAGEIKELDDSVKHLGSDVQNLDTAVANLDTKVTNVDVKVTNLDTQVANLDTAVANFGTVVTDNNNKVASLEAEAEEAKNALGEADAENARGLSDLRKEYEEKAAALDEADASIRDELTEKAAELGEADASIRGDLAEHTETLKALGEADEALREADEALRAELDKKADATATEEALAGKSAIKVGGEVVAEFDADTKIDKVEPHWNSNGVVAVKKDGTYFVYPVYGTKEAYTLAYREAGGVIRVGTAVGNDDAVPLAQMNEALTEKASVKTVDTLAKKVENLEAGTAPDMFVLDDATAYVKTIPTDAAPYAELLAVGGMTHKVGKVGENLFNPLVVSGYESEVSAEADGTIYMNWTCFGWGAMFYDLFPDIVVGKKYIFSASASGGDLQPASIDVGGIPLDTPFTLTEEQYSIYIRLNNGFADDGAAGQPCGGTFYISLYEYSDELIDAKVTALDIKNASGEVTRTFAIPEAVQALDGYGKTGYGIEWDEDGKPWWVTPNARTDISQYFTEDNLIPVEGGGTITAVNEHALAAPTTIVYQATEQSLADAFDEVHQYAMKVIGGNA